MHKLLIFLTTVIVTPLSFLPLRWSQAIGGTLGTLLIRYNKKRSHVAQTNIQLCFPELSLEEQEKLLQENAQETGKWFMETSYVWFRKPEYLSRKTNVRNPEVLQQAYEKGRGVVVVLPHLGNWEILNFYVPWHYRFGGMYRPIKSPVFEDIVFNSRSRLGSAMFSVDTRGVRHAFKALKKNTVIAILSDHLPSEETGVHAPFFNRPAFTGKLTQSLVKHNDSPVLTAAIIRKPKGEGFDIVFDEVEGLNVENPVDAASALNAAIEKCIRLAPAQYQWVYRRFAKPPIGTPEVYTDLYKAGTIRKG